MPPTINIGGGQLPPCPPPPSGASPAVGTSFPTFHSRHTNIKAVKAVKIADTRTVSLAPYFVKQKLHFTYPTGTRSQPGGFRGVRSNPPFE